MRQEQLEQKIRVITENTNLDYFEVITFSDDEIDCWVTKIKSNKGNEKKVRLDNLEDIFFYPLPSQNKLR